MEIIKFKEEQIELPFKIVFNAEYMYQQIEEASNDSNHLFQSHCQKLLSKLNNYTELREGIDDFNRLEQYSQELDLLFKPLFPDALQLNEIKMVVMPFKYAGFQPTKRLSNILKQAGDDFRMSYMNYAPEQIYFYACSYILAAHYHQPLKVNRPFYIDIPNEQTGQVRHYRAFLNGDFMKLEKTSAAPDLTQEDIDELLLHGGDIEFWKTKFPPNSYLVKGFAIMNLFDITQDELIAQTRSLFLRDDDQIFNDFRKNLQLLFQLPDLQVGYSLYNLHTGQTSNDFFNHGATSLFLEENEMIAYEDIFCHNIMSCTFIENRIFVMPDVETYGKRTHQNLFYKKLAKKDLKSLILIPLKLGEDFLQLIELGGLQKYDLNAINADVLEEIIPFIKIASERFLKESQNTIESTIQENYTSIHPSVKWRFVNAATAFNEQKARGIESPELENIVFEKVYPLYGQSDIKGSSVARNEAIQEDLDLQLSLIISTLEKVMELQSFPIYKKLIFRVKKYLNKVKIGLKAGDEVGILQFLKKEIYPVFNHVRSINNDFNKLVEDYMTHIDPTLHVVYKARKAYDDSVHMLNDKLANHLDKKQIEAQKMFPHYFQRYKTDGVEYNIYMGASLVDHKPFDPLYLQNLCLWQLETMYELEQIAYDLTFEMPYPLQVASLILVHQNPLAIKFQMDGKQFDVDGAYNARYEIIKKRIDKSHIKGTDERLTQPGKIAIVYSQDEEAQEYLNYLEFLQAEGIFGQIEMLDLEDLQGVSGLKAIRVEVLYKTHEIKALNGTATNELVKTNF